jgi:transketolase
MQMRDYFIDKIYNYALKNKNVILITNEQGAQSLDKFREDLPEQFINAGISEQNIITVASGLARQKKKVYIYSIASFITLRCFEQIKLDINLMNLPVTIFGVGASYSYDTSGPTHHSIEDISILRTMSNLEIFSPSDNNVLDYIFKHSVKSRAPIYVRLDRQQLPNIPRDDINFRSGFYNINQSSRAFIISTGNMSHVALEAIKILNKNYNLKISFIDVFAINFLKTELMKVIKNAKLILTLEEHVLDGGLGSIISELLFDEKINYNLSLVRMGINKYNLYTYKSRKLIHKINKIDLENIVKKILKNKKIL